MHRPIACLALVLALGACGKNEEQRRKENAAAVAQVEAAQNQLPPIQPLTLAPLLPADLARIDEVGSRCDYVPTEAGGAPPVLVAMGSYGWIKLKDELLQLAGDIGGEQGPGRTWTHYTGKEVSLRLLAPASGATPDAARPADPVVRLVLRDRWDRPVYEQTLVRSCRD